MRPVSRIYPYVELASSNAIEFQTKAGPIDGVMLIIGPSSGFISVKAEGSQSEYMVWDPWCIYDRLQAIIFNRPVPRMSWSASRLWTGLFLIHRTCPSRCGSPAFWFIELAPAYRGDE